MTPDCTNRVTTVVDMNDYLALEAERDEALQQRDEARALLREVEWADAGRCLFCHRLGTVNNEQEPYGHAPDCRLKAALEGRDG